MSDAPNPNTPEGQIHQTSDFADGVLAPGGRRRLRGRLVVLAYVLVPLLLLIVALVFWH
jgi:hypothetical protein